MASPVLFEALCNIAFLFAEVVRPSNCVKSSLLEISLKTLTTGESSTAPCDRYFLASAIVRKGHEELNPLLSSFPSKLDCGST